MKISQSIVVAALLGLISQSEVVEAVQRHHHHRNQYVQFIPKIHPDGVILFKDLGVGNNGYPYQSLSVADPAPVAPAPVATKVAPTIPETP